MAFAGEYNQLFFRHIFIISAALKEFFSSGMFQGKSFTGSMPHRTYEAFIFDENGRMEYPDFYGDSFALDKLEENSSLEEWRVSRAVSGEYGYDVLRCGTKVLKPLAIYFNEYMEKFDQLKDIDKFAAPEEEEKPVKKSWWKRVWGKK